MCETRSSVHILAIACIKIIWKTHKLPSKQLDVGKSIISSAGLLIVQEIRMPIDSIRFNKSRFPRHWIVSISHHNPVNNQSWHHNIHDMQISFRQIPLNPSCHAVLISSSKYRLCISTWMSWDVQLKSRQNQWEITGFSRILPRTICQDVKTYAKTPLKLLNKRETSV